MKVQNALSLLKDGELCIVTTKNGEREVRWSIQSRAFIYLDRGTPVVCKPEEIEEWWPASMNDRNDLPRC